MFQKVNYINKSNGNTKKVRENFFKPVIQRKHAANIEAHTTNTAENYVSNLNGKGKSLDEPTKIFFKSKLGSDFSNVKIHNDSDAAESAQSVNALAYTFGNNIVFGENQFKPETNEGKKLLAHELTHIVQQNEKGTLTHLQRKSEFKKQKPEENINLAERFVQATEKGEQSSHFGKTDPTINGVDLTQTGIKNSLNIPSESDIQSSPADKLTECSFKTVPDNITSYKMWLPSNSEKWKYESDINRIKKLFGNKHCSNSIVTVILTGDPDSKTVYVNTKAHEEVHASHVEKLHKEIIEPFDKDISSRKVQGKDESTCKKSLLTYTQLRAKNVWADFVRNFTQLAKDFHDSPAGHNGIMGVSDIDSDCNWIKVKGKE
jgi:hypothetical protein